MCMFLTFSLPRLSSSYAEVVPLAAPYIVPVLQTSLTVSVYMTVAIAITALLYIIKPVTLDHHTPECKQGTVEFLSSRAKEGASSSLISIFLKVP